MRRVDTEPAAAGSKHEVIPDMHSLFHSLRIACLVVSSAASALAGGQITWTRDWEEGWQRAAAEKKVVFLAVNMDGEAANDRMAQKVYGDERVVSASAHTVNLVASRFDHSPDKRPCARFGGIECIEHKRIEGAARSEVLKGDGGGHVIAPQHVFLGPDRQVLLSVPYEVSAEELQWCFAAALKLLDPEAAKSVPTTGRPPRRLIQGGVFDAAGLPGAGVPPPTREQVLELIKELRASMWSEDRELKILRVLMSPEPEALDYIRTEFKNDLIGRRGWINPGGERGDPKDRMMHAIGLYSPPPYWKIAVEHLDHDDEKLRREAAVALEQLAVPDSVKGILSALGKEKNPLVKRDLMRALGSAGSQDEKARKALLKTVASEKDVVVRRNAIVALGWLAPGTEVNKALSDLLAAGPVEDRAAAAAAMGLSRNEAWIPFVEKAVAADASPEFKPHADAALEVLRGAAFSVLRTSIRTLCEDAHEREKFFGVAP